MVNSISSKKIINDLTYHVKINKGFHIWMAFLSVCLGVCLYAYIIQLRIGLGVTGMRDFVSWGMYISNFVFFVASALVGMLISAVLGLSGQKWITPIARIAEIIAIAFASVAGLVIVSDMGRPDRLLNVFIYGRFQSPILWDVTVVTTYTLVSVLLFYIPLIPDLAILKNDKTLPKWQSNIYNLMSINWKNSPEQQSLAKNAIRILLILIIPIALAIHTVTSWLFAFTPRVGWNSTIMGPYFVAGAFVAGVAAVVIVMYILRKIYNLQDYITDMHFDKTAKLLVLVSLVYLYFNINEYFVPGYKMQKSEAIHLHELFDGRFSFLFWSVQIFGLVLPIILLLIKPFRKPLPLFVIGIFVLVGSWFKRYLIVIPTMENPLLPIQNEPQNFAIYTPTVIEIAVTMGSLIMVVMIISTLAKLFPVVPVHETIEEMSNEHTNETHK
jgi:molybdopterin-containing oxidoreductase family membrane subunit